MTPVTQAQRVGQTVMQNGSGAPPGYRRGLSALIADAFFEYAVNFTFTTGSETFTSVIPIQADAHFLCVQSMYDNSVEIGSTGTAATSLQGGGVVILTDGASQRFLSNIPVPVSCLFGKAKEPYVWPFTHLFKANGFIGVQVTGAGVTVPSMAGAILRLVFAGYKVPIGSIPEIGL